jgi:hypothetical protein
MKRILIALLLLPFFANAQQIETSETGLPLKDGKVVFERVFEVSNYKREDIYASIKKWVVDNFTHSRNLIQSEDKESGQFIGMGSTDVLVSGKRTIYTMEFAIQVNCKNDKFRIRFYDISTAAMRSGIISADLRTAGGIIPAEKYAYFPRDKKLSDKQIGEVLAVNKHINDHFTLLLENINKSVKRSNTDDF